MSLLHDRTDPLGETFEPSPLAKRAAIRFPVTLAVSAAMACAAGGAASAGTYLLFAHGAAFCTAYNWAKTDGFVARSARIRGAWQSVLLLRNGQTVRSHQAAALPSPYQPLGRQWRGGPFVCTAAVGGVICASTSGHGFGINGKGITTR
jgi:hypothetical protein